MLKVSTVLYSALMTPEAALDYIFSEEFESQAMKEYEKMLNTTEPAVEILGDTWPAGTALRRISRIGFQAHFDEWNESCRRVMKELLPTIEKDEFYQYGELFMIEGV